MKVCFLWHMHQPYYKDPVSGSYILPWVRLHAIKNYVALPRIFRNFPNVRHTFNLVPSLLMQVKDYVENGASDTFLDVSRKNALDLSRDEREFILKNFFSAFAPTMILPQPRYAELYRGHESALRSISREGGIGTYGSSEYTDLVSLFNLTWFHPILREEDPELSRLWRKGGGYTEKEKQYILDRQIYVMNEVFEEYRKFESKDGGELSSSPKYHPILPLLIDNRSALDARPDAPLPSRLFAYPRDAWRQLEDGREVFRTLFGSYPKGLWPSEGSVSPAMVEMAANAGFQWIATDEALLSRVMRKSILRDADGVPFEPAWFYRPYTAQTVSGETKMVFRDHHLSDLIGFEYSRWDANDAVSNFSHILQMIHRKIESSGTNLSQDDFIVPIILDGENAWEYYYDSGTYFLNALLSKLSSLSPNIEFVPLGEAISKVKSSDMLPEIPTGSWIDGTFNVWIGSREDHIAWEMLSRARAAWEAKAVPFESKGVALPKMLKQAEEYLFVAEGSDWCWWYGDEHFTPHAPEFDMLFRNNLKAAYIAMEIDVPDALEIPITNIKREKDSEEKNLIVAPGSYIQPKIDGMVNSYLEWSDATEFVPDSGFGSMHRAGKLILASFCYGFSKDLLFFRFDLNPEAMESISEFEFEILFPVKNRKVKGEISKDAVSAANWRIFEINETQDASGVNNSIDAAYKKVLEVGVPIDLIGCCVDKRLEFFLMIQPKGAIGERWPLYGTFSAELAGADFEDRNWSV